MNESILFARFAKCIDPGTSSYIEVNASMSPDEYSIQFLHTWSKSMEINSTLQSYIQESKLKMNPQNEKLKYKNKIGTRKKYDSYKNKTKVKIHIDEIKHIFKPRTTDMYISTLCEIRISSRLNVAEITLRFSANDLLPICKFEKLPPEDPIIMDHLDFFKFRIIQ